MDSEIRTPPSPGVVSSPASVPPVQAAWPVAVQLLGRWLADRERVDRVMEEVPPGLTPVERARCQHLVFGVIRHASRLEEALSRLIAHPPRFVTRAALFVAGFELIEAGQDGASAPGQTAKVVHYAVEQTKTLASPAEARMVNAVARRLAAALQAEVPPPALAPAAALAAYFSHPLWLVRRWLTEFGAAPTRALLEWNQRPAPVYARWRPLATDPRPDWLRPTRWPDFWEVPPGRWPEIEPLVKGGSLYLQDPGTRGAVDLLAPAAGETLLDLCAAPGGKTVAMADRAGSGRVVAFDLPGDRLIHLRENLAVIRGVETCLVPGNLFEEPGLALSQQGQPLSYAGVLLDAPCSNTGVMRHRVDVKWRLQEGDFTRHARQQTALLLAAGRLVAPGGRLVYSTCSLDPEENGQVVRSFLARAPGFSLEAETVTVPWESGHDGAAAFRLRRAAAP
jgi:16S rRNA (cytosine967-C5)-methyltransferase